jgi:HD-GYP domain-containing protein (c-di-GMP phosphodiesterase class II)
MHAMNDAPDDRRPSLSNPVRSLGTILFEEFGVPFRFFGASDGREVPPADRPSCGSELPDDGRAWVVQFGAVEQSKVILVPGGGYRLAISLHADGQPAQVALGQAASIARPHPEAIRQESMRLEKWLHAVFERLRAASQVERRHRADAPGTATTAEPGNASRPSEAWEVIVRLEQLMRVQKTHKDPVKNRQRVLRQAAELVPAQSLVFVPTRADDDVVAVGGSLLSSWDYSQLATLISRSVDWEKTGYLLLNDIATGSWSARFPQIETLLAFPVLDGSPIGWFIALNKNPAGAPAAPRSTGAPHDPARPADDRAARDSSRQVVRFRRTDAAMLAPFASLLGYHARAFQRYNHVRDLLVGLTRSLTAAIDAKDSYTYGHSERVARIAVELGRELGLAEDELSDIYLAGLLHDIGKIGIRDEVLGKRGPLDDQEFEHIKEHVKIGFRILSGLRSIAHLLPGVLYHHERYDGQGYPEGLKGNAIPFIARILAVADSYDAMSTSRPYRVAMTSENVEQVLAAGANTQWDKAVVDAFVRCKERVHAIRQRGVGESLCGALDDALQKGTGKQALSSMVSILVS